VPVLLGARRSQLTPYGGPVRRILALRTRTDTRVRTYPPMRTRALTIAVWMSEPSR